MTQKNKLKIFPVNPARPSVLGVKAYPDLASIPDPVELAEACGIQSHVASEHLRLMRDRTLLVSERRGRRIYHRVAEEGLQVAQPRLGPERLRPRPQRKALRLRRHGKPLPRLLLHRPPHPGPDRQPAGGNVSLGVQVSWGLRVFSSFDPKTPRPRDTQTPPEPSPKSEA